MSGNKVALLGIRSDFGKQIHSLSDEYKKRFIYIEDGISLMGHKFDDVIMLHNWRRGYKNPDYTLKKVYERKSNKK